MKTSKWIVKIKISKSIYFRDDFEKLMVMKNVQC